MLKNFIVALLVWAMIPHISWAFEKEDAKPLYWVAPMDANYKRDKPGKSPMGMDLVPVYANKMSTLSNEEGATISPTVVQNIGVRTARVMRENLPRIIDTVGYVGVDENYIEHLHSYENGWIKKLYVKESGEHVKKGQVLMAIYSPELIYAQQELVLALKNKSLKKGALRDGANPLGDYEDKLDYINAAKLKLNALGVSDKQIARIKKNKKSEMLVDIEAPMSGIISEFGVREGMYVTPTLNLVTIESLSKIWVVAEVYSKQGEWVEIGQKVEATFDDFPSKKWSGKVEFIGHMLNPITRTLEVRLAFDNINHELKHNMLANVKIFAKPQLNALTIPREALIRSGKGDRVILDLGKGNFVAQEVEIGVESDGKYEILAGLKQGEIVVTSAQFLIDSESSVTAGIRRITVDNPHANMDEAMNHD